MMIPLIRVLQANFPQASLTWVISRPAYDIVEGMEGIEFIIIDKPNSLRDYWRFKQRIKNQSFDVLLATHSCLRANLLYPLIKAARKIGFDSLRAKDGHSWFISETIQPGNDHTLDSFLKFADVLEVEKKDIHWDIPISKACRDWARAHLPATDVPIVLVNPSASKPERSWSVERYSEVIRHLQNKWRAQIVLTGGPGRHDQTLGQAITDKIPTLINLIGKSKPKQLMALIEHADLLLCPDTGPSHMAAAVGTPVIALHAVTSADVSGPYLFRHLAVDCYPEAVQTILNKTTETNVWGTHAHGENTMALVTVDSVITKVDSVLSELFKS